MPAQSNSPPLGASPATGVSSGHHAQVLDRAAMLASVEQDLDLLRELAELFFAESPGQLAQIRTGIAERNPELVERCAHTLKGALATFGALRASAVAREVEIHGRGAHLEDVAAHISTLEAEVAQACAALSDYLREVKSERTPR